MANKVEYYYGATLIGTGTVAPDYPFDWVGAPVGTHSLTAKYYVDEVLQHTSTGISVTVEAAAVTGYILDNFPGYDLAWSISRKLSTSHALAFEIVNNAGVPLDIGFDVNGDTDIAAIIAHTGSGDINLMSRISKLYGANGVDMVQVNDGNRPIICTNGVVNTKNGRLALYSPNNAGFMVGIILKAAVSGLSANASDFIVMSSTGVKTNTLAGGTTWWGAMAPADTSTLINSPNTGTPTIFIDGTQFTGTTRGDLNTAIKTGEIRIVRTDDLNLSAVTEFSSKLDNTIYWPLENFFERIVYPDPSSSIKAAIESNQQSYYNPA